MQEPAAQGPQARGESGVPVSIAVSSGGSVSNAVSASLSACDESWASGEALSAGLSSVSLDSQEDQGETEQHDRPQKVPTLFETRWGSSSHGVPIPTVRV